jgi:heat shock protein HtpX
MMNQLKTVLLLGSLSALVVGVGGALAPGRLWLFAGLALLMNLGAYFFSDKMVLAMHGAREVSPGEAPGLHRMVEDLSRRAGLPKPRVCIMPDAQPNAFATGRNPEHGVVAVTEGLMRILGERELRGVIAHELAHIKNRDILISSIAAACSSMLTSVAQMAGFAAMTGRDDDEGGSGAGGLALALVAPIAATLIQMGISRSREYLADETGARICGDPEGLARALLALERGAEVIPGDARPATASLFIVNPLAGSRGGGLLALFSTHPQIPERVRRLRAMAGA